MGLIMRIEQDSIKEVAVFLNACWRSAYAGILDAGFLGGLSDEARAEALQKSQDAGILEILCLRDGAGRRDDEERGSDGGGGPLVGVCGFGRSTTTEYPDDGEIHAAYLLPEHIGKGHGHALFCEAERLLAKQGYAAFVVNTFSANARALAFYVRHGYAPVKESSIEFGGKRYPYKTLRKQIDKP